MRIAIVAGETSGDHLGGGLLQAIRSRYPSVDVEGIGGPSMIAAGCKSLYPIERLSVMGLFEAVTRIPELVALRARLKRQFITNPPDVFIGIDAPEFNLSLEEALKRRGIATVHYVSPQVWAWRGYRVRRIARSVDRMLTLFPFEECFYREQGVPVSFVGHPLADAIPSVVDRQSARRALGLSPDAEVVALLPGSRMSEVKFLAQPMFATARWLLARRRGVQFVLPTVNADTRKYCERVLGCEGLEVTISDGNSRTGLAAADVVLLASGTATLEALLLKRPMVVTYRTNRLTYYIARAAISVDCISLPNLLAGRRIVPELLQDEATPAKLGPAVLRFLQRPELQRGLDAEFENIHSRLRRNANERAAEAVLDLVG